MKTNDDRQHLTQAQPRFAVTLFWGPCQQVLLPARLKEFAKVVNGAKNRYSIHRNLPPNDKSLSAISTSSLGYAGSFSTSLTSNSRLINASANGTNNKARAPVKYSVKGDNIVRLKDSIRRPSDYATPHLAAAGRDFGGGRQESPTH